MGHPFERSEEQTGTWVTPPNLSYSYDLAGRRTGVGGSLARTNLPAAVPNAVYNSNNQLTQWGSTTLSYDLNGNTLNDGVNGYVWDARNRLVAANNNGASFSYNPLGRRMGKTILSANTNYLYDGANPVQELNGTTPTANLLTGGIDERFTRTDSTGTSNFITDALGSTLALTDSTGNQQTQYTYDPFGNMSISGPASTNSYTYTGRETDGLGINYYRARYYNPATGRFLSEDPTEFEGGSINLYAYANDDPIDYTDPTGCGVKNCAAAIAELTAALARLAQREAEHAAHGGRDCGGMNHDKAIEQAKNQVRKAAQKARGCLPDEELDAILNGLNKMIQGIDPKVGVGIGIGIGIGVGIAICPECIVLAPVFAF